MVKKFILFIVPWLVVSGLYCRSLPTFDLSKYNLPYIGYIYFNLGDDHNLRISGDWIDPHLKKFFKLENRGDYIRLSYNNKLLASLSTEHFVGDYLITKSFFIEDVPYFIIIVDGYNWGGVYGESEKVYLFRIEKTRREFIPKYVMHIITFYGQHNSADGTDYQFGIFEMVGDKYHHNYEGINVYSIWAPLGNDVHGWRLAFGISKYIASSDGKLHLKKRKTYVVIPDAEENNLISGDKRNILYNPDSEFPRVVREILNVFKTNEMAIKNIVENINRKDGNVKMKKIIIKEIKKCCPQMLKK